jgi:hypothetical protein
MRNALVVTSVSAPNQALRELASGASARGIDFYVIGDLASPTDFELDGCRFYSVDHQVETGFRTAELCPTRHYARKNVGYLLAARDKAEIIVETDDDNLPFPSFWNARSNSISCQTLGNAGWVNVYRYFSGQNIWPRGFPLTELLRDPPSFESLGVGKAIDCPIQQGLADESPDVDAIYRLVIRAPVHFLKGRSIALGSGSWCPFNSQNTAWWREAFPLLYLPACCTFRMTDIWRSFVAQRIAWANGWSVLFHEPTVWQDRNVHNLLKDFESEIPGYLLNGPIVEALEALSLPSGQDRIFDCLRLCYEALVRRSYLDGQELKLLEAWIEDLQAIE